MRRAWGIFCASALFVVLVVLQAFGDGGALKVQPGGVAAGYQASNAEVYRATADGDDAAAIDSSTITDLDQIYCGGMQTVAVSGRHSVASATVVCQAIRYDKDGVITSVYEFTLTAKDRSTLSSAYFSNSVQIDTEACAYMRIAIEDPSSGTVDLWTSVY